MTSLLSKCDQVSIVPCLKSSTGIKLPSPPPMAEEIPNLEKLSVSSATLASLLHRFTSSSGDLDGLLFGHLSLLPPILHDDDHLHLHSSSSSSAASITGYFCSGFPMHFYDHLGHVNPSSFPSSSSSSSLLGWFSARRLSPLRPSMRELAVSISLSKTLTPCVFLLLSSSASPNNSIHTIDFRAFVVSGGVLEPRSLDLVNLGLGLWGQSGNFSAESALPWIPTGIKKGKGKSIGRTQEVAREKKVLDKFVEGFEIERLEQMVGAGAGKCIPELEDLYGRMLLKLESLARLVEKSSARVLQQENHNLRLQSKIVGLE
ncbi:uncharacterized protein [Typha angustifolia]|uniref:uncharacterized protein n=1 Tax=Typha angustifolia TaxID=59011 RepID=UPI003C2F0892